MKQIIIDTNLLVLLIVGLTDCRLIGKHKRTRSFEVADYDLLVNALSMYDEIVVTPHILTETSNLIAQTAESVASSLRITLSELLKTQREEFEPSFDVIKHNSFLRLGLTDSAIMRLVEKNIPLITVDLDLYLAAEKHHPNVVNFTHLRQERMFGG
jgi:hypothetical protein